MGKTQIEWCDFSFNPWRGCQKVSPACKFCYAETRGNRFGEDFSGQRIVLSDAGWKNPLKWNREAEANGVRRKVFCASLADVFEEWEDEMVDHRGGELSRCENDCQEWLEWNDCFCPGCGSEGLHVTMDDVRLRLFELIDATPYLDWMLLTKRPENIRKMWLSPRSIAEETGGHPLLHRDNVWLGTTVENQEQADKRIPELLKCRGLARNLFLSCEPLLGSVDLLFDSECSDWQCSQCESRNVNSDLHDDDGRWWQCHDCCFSEIGEPDWKSQINWVIAGGESGTKARPSHPDWFRSLRDQCKDAGVPFFFKQWGKFKNGDILQPVGKKKAGRLLDGVEHNGVPEVNRG